MNRTQLIVSYRGSGYVGWQRQTNGLSVQQVIEEAVERLIGSPVSALAAGRTDAGVHALGQSIHVDTEKKLAISGWVHGTNRLLPQDVRILDARPRPESFHARFGAVRKEYRYQVSTATVVNALDSWRCLRVSPSIDFERMNQATKLLVGSHDFRAFALSGGGHKDSNRIVYTASWRVKGPQATFGISGNGFLRGMVRSIVGTLLEVGLARRSPENVAELLEGRPRGEAGPTAAAKGLVLQRVVYSDSTRENNAAGGG